MNTNGKKSPLNECIHFIEKCKKEGLKGDTPYNEGEEAESFDITGERIFKIPECDERRKLYILTFLINSLTDIQKSTRTIPSFLYIKIKNKIKSISKDLF